MITDELQLAVLGRFAEELAEAGDAQFQHLAQRAEANYRNAEFGDRMRALVDHERTSRDVIWGAVR